MNNNKHSGRPKGCNNTPGEKACKKRQKNSRNNNTCLCRHCKAVDGNGKRVCNP